MKNNEEQSNIEICSKCGHELMDCNCTIDDSDMDYYPVHIMSSKSIIIDNNNLLMNDYFNVQHHYL